VHQGTAVFSCSASTAAWAGSLTCSAMSCGALTLADGSTSGQCDGAVGDSCVMVSCDAGYSLSHAAGTARECQYDGTWSGDVVFCAGIPCTVNTVIANSDRTVSNPCVTGTSSNCVFTCDAGFHVQGTHACAADGTLSGGSCARNACTAGLTLADSPTTCAGVFEEVCTYACDAGMSYSAPHICGVDGSFTGGLCVLCSSVLQEMLDWLQTDSAVFNYCPTADVAAYQGSLTVARGKALYFDGSGGSGGSVDFNGVFRTGEFFGSATLTDVTVAAMDAWGTGSNGNGHLGLGDTTGRITPERLASPTNVVRLESGYYHTVFLDANGAVRLITFIVVFAEPCTNFSIRFCLLCCSCVTTGVDDGSQRRWAAGLGRYDRSGHADAACHEHRACECWWREHVE
jgi:hypothetical protein